MKRVPMVTVVLFTAVLTLGYVNYMNQMDLKKAREAVNRLQLQLSLAALREQEEKKVDRNLPDIDTTFLAKVRRNGKVVLPTETEIGLMSPAAALETIHSYLSNIEMVCNRMLRMGNVRDGGWEVCDDEQYRPVSPCLVYSFGVNNDFSFEDYTASNYGCEIFSFDPSMKENQNRSALVTFYTIGISSRDVTKQRSEDWEMRTLTSLRRQFRHYQRNLDILKMDIEGSEWSVLKNIIESRETGHIRQLFVEFHLWDKKNILEDLKILKQLYDLGFRKFHSHSNDACRFEDSPTLPVQRTECYEVYFVNTKFGKVS